MNEAFSGVFVVAGVFLFMFLVSLILDRISFGGNRKNKKRYGSDLLQNQDNFERSSEYHMDNINGYLWDDSEQNNESSDTELDKEEEEEDFVESYKKGELTENAQGERVIRMLDYPNTEYLLDEDNEEECQGAVLGDLVLYDRYDPDVTGIIEVITYNHRDIPKPFEVWRHHKAGEFEILGIALLENEEDIEYCSNVYTEAQIISDNEDLGMSTIYYGDNKGFYFYLEDSEDDEDEFRYVLYRPIGERNKIYARPLIEFMSKVSVDIEEQYSDLDYRFVKVM